MKHKALNQLLCAAVVNESFCQTLLRDPLRAISGGYQGQTFALTSEERDLVTGIQAGRLEDFANQVYHWVSANGNGRNGNGNGHKQRDGELWVELYSAAA
jgi:hypothetical protein